MSGAAVVIIIGGGGTQQNRSADEVTEDGGNVRVKVTAGEGETVSNALRRAADILDGTG